ncbi:pseudoazurin [Shinella sp. SUS2]|uniref:pseudoazurin n=2 Tax=unclassified Shinella TaxID=2643062 RepID=UPI0003C53ADB|nr:MULTISPECIES: pseudoazurin [unclassified Shinella]MCA0343115.1 pseudoazurin [Pseudomonadota bacterium]EYR78699.1 pseudoazurin [Shinella sp. DD12]KNY17162.1 pseudoazurin [Shinella sp. SUS2]KOC76815.1 pseudoazurin [Shinella sp. GWS1]MCO5153219.1 pseudoazurin [Shinella sp.]
MRTMAKSIVGAAAVILALALPAAAADFEVHMLNKGAEGAMVFEPAFVKVAPGDTITFIPTDKGHNVETIKGMIPEGAEAFKSKINENFKVTFDKAGAYGVKCTPHVGMGMVGVVVVGDAPANLDAVKTGKLPKKARERMDAAIAAAGL